MQQTGWPGQQLLLGRLIEAISVRVPTRWQLSCCCYDYYVGVRLQNCVVHCVLSLIRCIISNACHAEQKYTQDGGCGKKADGLYGV